GPGRAGGGLMMPDRGDDWLRRLPVHSHGEMTALGFRWIENEDGMSGHWTLPRSVVNAVSKSPNEVPNPSRSEYANDWQENVIDPLIQMKDHLHWLAVVRRKRTARWFEIAIEGVLRMAYDY